MQQPVTNGTAGEQGEGEATRRPARPRARAGRGNAACGSPEKPDKDPFHRAGPVPPPDWSAQPGPYRDAPEDKAKLVKRYVSVHISSAGDVQQAPQLELLKVERGGPSDAQRTRRHLRIKYGDQPDSAQRRRR